MEWFNRSVYYLIVCRKLCPSRFRYYIPLAVTLCLVMPAVVPWYFWDESFQTAFFVASVFRYVLTLHATWLTNSAAHIWGHHPYDKWVALSLAVAYIMYIVVHTLWFNVETSVGCSNMFFAEKSNHPTADWLPFSVWVNGTTIITFSPETIE